MITTQRLLDAWPDGEPDNGFTFDEVVEDELDGWSTIDLKDLIAELIFILAGLAK